MSASYSNRFSSTNMRERQGIGAPSSINNVPSYKGTRRDLPHDDYVKVENNVPNLSNEDIYIDLVQHNPVYLDTNVDILDPTSKIRNNILSIPAQYKETRSEPLLYKPNDYKMTVAKFEIPSNAIPFFYWKDRAYYVSMSETLQNITEEVELQYLYLVNPAPGVVADDQRAILSIQQLLNMLNLAMTTCFNNMITSYETATGTPGSWIADGHPSNAPTMYYDSGRKQFNMSADLEWADPTNHYTYLYFNTGLSQLFQGFPYIAQTNAIATNIPPAVVDVKEYQFLFSKTQQPTTLTNKNIQYEDGKSVSDWYDTFKIVLVSNTIPARAEYIGGIQRKLIDGQLSATELTNNNSTNTLQILTEFTYEFNEPINEPLIYLPTGEWRWIDLMTDTPLVNIDLQAFTLSYEGELRPILLVPGTNLYGKLLFRKK